MARGDETVTCSWWLRASAIVALVVASACTPAEDGSKAHGRASAALSRGELSEALAVVDDALSRTDRLPPELVARLRLLRSDILIERGDPTAALSELAGSVPASAGQALQGQQQFLTAKALRNQGQLQQAVDRLEEAKRWAAEDPHLQLQIEWLSAQLLLRMGRMDAGEARLRDVRAKSSTSGERAIEALAHLDLGMSRLLRNRYDEALAWLEPALGFSDIEETATYGKILNNAGICYARLGLFDRAVKTQERAVAIHRRRRATEPLLQAVGSLGVTHGLRGAYAEALPYFQEAFELAKGLRQPREAWIWATNMAAAHARLAQWDRAEYYNQQSRELGKGLDGIREVHNTLVAGDIALAKNDIQAAAGLYEQALADPEGAPAVRWSAEAGLAATAIVAQQPDKAGRHFEAALDTLERTRLDLLKTDYKLSFFTQLIEFYQSYVDALVAQGLNDRALEIADSSRGRVLAERQRVAAPVRTGAAAFRRVAGRTRAVLLTYWLAPKRSFLWVVTGGGIQRVDLPPAAEIEAAVRDYRALIDNSLTDPLATAGSAGDRLYAMLVAPARIPTGSSVVIVPDGGLHGINFETLPVDGPRRHYWIEDAEVQIAPSLSMLTASAIRKPRDPALLLIGNPTPRAPEFPALSYAPAEMTSIVRHFQQSQVTAYDSARATPAVYRETPLDRFSMIHFTAHATANLESPLDSAVVLSGPDTAFKLYARDVADQPLTADLVTVSACRSAGERAYSGEGLVGFAWAFLRAGARRVVAGLWDVDDRSTARLMDEMYAGIQAGKAPVRALRSAKLTLIQGGGQLARPYYWGPFQLFTVTP